MCRIFATLTVTRVTAGASGRRISGSSWRCMGTVDNVLQINAQSTVTVNLETQTQDADQRTLFGRGNISPPGNCPVQATSKKNNPRIRSNV